MRRSIWGWTLPLTITALVDASLIFNRPEWLKAGRRAFDFIVTNMNRHHRLGHAWRAGRLQKEAMLDDYAALSRAALALFEATGESDYLRRAEAWVSTVDGSATSVGLTPDTGPGSEPAAHTMTSFGAMERLMASTTSACGCRTRPCAKRSWSIIRRSFIGFDH